MASPRYAFHACPTVLSEKNAFACGSNFHPRIAVQVHIFYTDLIKELVDSINNIPYPFDCYVSTDTQEKKKVIEDYLSHKCAAAFSIVEVFPNRGRDVAPFVLQMRSCVKNYDYICHIHSKRSETVKFGDRWRKYLIKNLLGSKEYVSSLLSAFELDKSIGLVYPETYPVVLPGATWSGARDGVRQLVSAMGFTCSIPETDQPIFPAGNMFWARAEAVAPLFNLKLSFRDFPSEEGQTNCTMAHVIERCWSFLAAAQGYTTKRFMNGFNSGSDGSCVKRLTIFVHFDPDNTISNEDIYYISEVSSISTKTVFITNSSLPENEISKIDSVVDEFFLRDNTGYDFGAWCDYFATANREALLSYDEVVMCNNSCVGPIGGFSRLFSEMKEVVADFWGITLYPYHDSIKCLDPSDDGSGYIPEHLQSYFIVLRNRVLKAESFWSFWSQYTASNDYLSTILQGELVFTKMLSDSGLSYAAYLPESLDIGIWHGTEQPQNELGYEYALLGSPLIKKKCKIFLSEDKRQALVDYLHETNADESIVSFFKEREGGFVRNSVLAAGEDKASHMQEILGIHRPNTKALSVQQMFWFVADRRVVPFSIEDFQEHSASELIVNWIVPPMGRGSGGHMTLFRFMTGLEKKGFHSRLYLYGDHSFVDDSDLGRFLGENYPVLDSRIEAFCDVSRMSFGHIAIATEWKTAYCLKRFDNTISKFYFIQDYEPLFYPQGSEYRFANATYDFGFRAITAGEWLKDLMKDRFDVEASSFSFSTSREIYHPRPRTTKGRRIFFYARPVTPRRDFELGILALNEVCRKMPEVVVEFAGWDIGSYVIPFKHVNHGIVNAEDLAQLYCECDICLVLSGTNLSLVPLEVMSCGSVAVCSDGANSAWLVNECNGVVVPEDPRKIADEIELYLKNPDLLNQIREYGVEFANKTSWDKEIDKVYRALLRGYEADLNAVLSRF